MRRPWTTGLTLTVLTGTAALTTGTAAATTLLSDDFNRDAGTFGTPPGTFASDWGANNNGLGGTLSADYSDAFGSTGSDFNVDWVDGSVGVLAFDRTIHNANLATQSAIDAGGIIVQFDINPSDAGGGSFNGRDWGGLGLSDTNSTAAVGGAAALANTNVDVRAAIAPRNSGTAITKRATAAGANFEIRAGGSPSSLTEPIFDPSTYNDYVDAFNVDGPGDPTQFESPLWYTVRIIVRESSPGNLFATDATNLIEVYIGEQGGPLSRIDLNPSTTALEDTLVWGDNQKTAGGVAANVDPSPTGRYAYAVFGANGNGHVFDNYIVSLVPEPTSMSLLALGAASLAIRRRPSA